MREDQNTESKLYSVSEAVQKCGVPSHVLRYWEEELDLPIQRTAQGHRIYSEENLVTFRRVKELKNKGIQLKAIRLMLDETEDGRVLEHFFEQGERVPEAGVTGEIALRKEEVTETADRIPEYERSTGATRAIFWRDERQDGEAGVENELNEQNEWNEKDVRESGETEKSEETEATDAWDSQEAEYEIIPSSEATNYQRFESMLRSLVSEAVAEQNEKLEQALAELIRDEIEDLYIQLCQDEGQREAAVADEQPGVRSARNMRLRDERDDHGRIRRFVNGILKRLLPDGRR